MTITQIIGLVVVLVLAVIAGIFITKSNKNTLVKWVTLFVLLSVSCTWIFAYGYFSGAEYSEYGMSRLGFSDIPNIFYYALNFAGDKIIFLLAVGCLYAVLSKIEGYKKLVSKIAKMMKGKEILFTVVTSLLFVVFASLLNQTFVALMFVPFVISIILAMKLDKLTAFSVTFGSILIGLLGVTYGGEGPYWFNYYTGLTLQTGLLYRALILVVAYILFNIINVLHIKKLQKVNLVNEADADPFKVEKVDESARTWPFIVILSFLLVLMILGHFDWKNVFGIEIFAKFHTWLMGLQIGDVAIFQSLFGTLAKDAAFGSWSLFHMSTIIMLMTVLIALIGRLKAADVFAAYGEGAKKMGKSIFLFIGIYMVMIAAYMAPFVPTIVNMVAGLTDSFNPFITTFLAFISNVFHTDFGFTGYTVGTFFVNAYAESTTLVHLIFTTMYGFMGIVAPTSAILMIGLGYLDIEFKSWIKYIWLFAVAILIILLVLFTVLAYI